MFSRTSVIGFSSLAQAIGTRVSDTTAETQEYIATIGYPAADSRIPEHELMSRLFGDKYNVKRLAPGQVMRLADELVMHDCSTLGGNSGSPMVNKAGDATITWRFTNSHNAWVAGTYFFVSSWYQSEPIKDYIRKAKERNPRLYRTIVGQYVFFLGTHVALLALEVSAR